MSNKVLKPFLKNATAALHRLKIYAIEVATTYCANRAEWLLEPVHDLCKCEEKACFSELQGAKISQGWWPWLVLQRRRSLKQAFSARLQRS
jgi:hypothetical protein